MKKMFLAAALAASMCVPAYASQFENSGDSVFDAPVYDEDIVANQVVEKSKKESRYVYIHPDRGTLTVTTNNKTDIITSIKVEIN